MSKDYFMMGILFLQIFFFAIAILSNKWDKKPLHYFILFILSAILVTHILAYNTDAEDAYIGFRYVKNFVEGKGLVFNTFDKVEGYSHFFWILIISGVYKLLHTDIPLTARYICMMLSVAALMYTYYLSFKFTQNRLLSYLAAFLVSTSGSFACYGLSGLENPLYALFILMIINYTYDQKWMLTGFLIGIMTMTRPEGFVIYFPVAIYIFLQETTLKDKFRTCFKVGIIAAIPVIPWTIWRVSYYGYLIPNTIAAKEGMDLFNQLKNGIIYTGYFFIIISESLLLLILLPLLNFFYTKQKIIMFFKDKTLLMFLVTAALFTAFYTYAGGDWMPCWRFFSSLIPLFSIIIAMIWNNNVFKTKNPDILKSNWIVLVFIFCGYVQVRNSFMNANMIPMVKPWYSSVQGLKVIGKWFHNTLPENTLLATFPNGAFSYYNELPTLDYGGLTDNQVGRFGNKSKTGKPGHIAENKAYILSKKPDIIAIMDGSGFVQGIHQTKEFIGYEQAAFCFSNYNNPNGKYVNINIRTDRKNEIIQYLLQDKSIKLVYITTP